ncbi:hypothetical protein LWI29_019684 [Acer saccharum]|uniref:Uncharacterized protein n=1 Tax=Acer saccharum TaxID=4024 RepID=A0AA39RI92_ACESA|nr:hypothetical protein LWI29_019684 [Acer saccharum]
MEVPPFSLDNIGGTESKDATTDQGAAMVCSALAWLARGRKRLASEQCVSFNLYHPGESPSSSPLPCIPPVAANHVDQVE